MSLDLRSSRAKSSSRIYYKRKAEGLCSRCAERAEIGKTQCYKCAIKSKISYHELEAKRWKLYLDYLEEQENGPTRS